MLYAPATARDGHGSDERTVVCDYHVFREDCRWEDDANRDGGKWIALKKGAAAVLGGRDPRTAGSSTWATRSAAPSSRCGTTRHTALEQER